jgi:hypothetical protein
MYPSAEALGLKSKRTKGPKFNHVGLSLGLTDLTGQRKENENAVQHREVFQ